MINLEKKKGQVTIFIILALIIIVGILSVYFLRVFPSTQINPQKDPQGFIEKCIGDSVQKSLKVIIPQGGLVNPDNYILFNNTKVEFLCYTPEERTLCEITTPLIKSSIENEIKLNSQGDVENCFQKLRSSFQNYDYSDEPMQYSVEITPDFIKATANKKITITKGGSSEQFNVFIYQQASSLFKTLLISNDILTRETSCNCATEVCNPDVLDISKLNPDFELSLFITGGNEKIYTIKDRLTKQPFNFAVRNCIRLP